MAYCQSSRKLIKTYLVLVVISCYNISLFAQLMPGKQKNEISLQETHIRPGEPGKTPFWNAYAKRFIYAPAFELPEVPGASKYEFSIECSNGKTQKFSADKPWAALSPVWNDVPEGYTTLTVVGLDSPGKVLGTSGVRTFYRSPGFSGEGKQPDSSYGQSSRIALKAIFDVPEVQHWLIDGKPDPSYGFYSYPNKVIGAMVRAMTAYSKVASNENDRKSALEIAKRTADYLLFVTLPANSPYSGIPPTYLHNVDKPTGAAIRNLKENWFMVVSSIDAAFGFMDLYDATKDEKYFDAATRVANTLIKNQEADGTWPHMVNYINGKPISPQRLIPTWIIFFFDRLDNQYKVTGYRSARTKAWNWITKNPLKTYQWDAQFEDIKLREPYVNLAREQACDVALLLLNKPNVSPKEIAQAEDLLRYSEDQFVVWSSVTEVDAWRKAMPDRRKGCDKWITPCVLEQYACYDPVARSSAVLINTYIKAYQVTGKPIYLSKAKALTNGLLEGQEWLAKNNKGNGEIPTWVMKSKLTNWLNNSYYAAEAVLNMSKIE